MYADASLLYQDHQPGLRVALNNIGVNQHYPRDVAYASQEYHGMELIDFAAGQGLAQLEFYIGHNQRGDRIGELIQIEKDNIQLVIGKESCPLDHPSRTTASYVETA